MASSLDEALGYDFFQEELEKRLRLYREAYGASPLTEHILHVFIEFASFNRFVEHPEALDQTLLDEFSLWLPQYNPELSRDKAMETASRFIDFVKSGIH